MPATLPTPETYPPSTQWRIVGLGVRVDDRTITIVVQFGHLQSGNFVPAREQRFDWNAATTPSFIQIVNNVPEFRDLRNALETFIVNQGILQGTVQ